MVRIVRRLDRDGFQNAASPLTNPMPLQGIPCRGIATPSRVQSKTPTAHDFGMTRRPVLVELESPRALDTTPLRCHEGGATSYLPSASLTVMLICF